jgi:mannose/fructose/sorbose-specific phosphotransferase system IIA component
MINIVVVSHGNLAIELINSAEMIAGEAENVYAITLQPGETPEMFEQKLNEVMETVCDQETLILIDIFSGTPYNVTARQVLKNQVDCVTGANLPMLIEAILSREDMTVSELAETIFQVGLNSVKNLKPMLKRK